MGSLKGRKSIREEEKRVGRIAVLKSDVGELQK